MYTLAYIPGLVQPLATVSAITGTRDRLAGQRR